jgi:hypothetical protein
MKRYDPDPNNWNTGPSWQFYLYGITGQRLATVGCNNPDAAPSELYQSAAAPPVRRAREV